ncbi:UNVERIFIED_CONTAM: putative ribonuclease H protein [Sesamum latifolium]|uniref:Ribonuclease H protein n=1 Tax=Sesamum latifolium TaxID=2727402 RepID=A0AAW2UGI3_9LAMI
MSIKLRVFLTRSKITGETASSYQPHVLQAWARYVIPTEEGEALTRPIVREEVKEAFFDIAEDKAPGPDGYSTGFFKAAWSVIGDELTAAIQDFLYFSPPQNAFVPGRRLATTSSLAYDTLEWDFVEAMLYMFGFPGKFIQWIMECISTTAFSVSLNGGLHGFFPGARGLRQGDPMSPYLFVLAMEVMHLLLLQWIEQSDSFRFHWHCEEMKLFNLCFADDLLLFCRAEEHSVILFRDVLHEFAEFSAFMLISIRVNCKPLLLKVDERLQGWGSLSLSFAARVQLLKSVISALNIYWAMAFILPKGVLKAVEARMRKFLWQGGRDSGAVKVAWIDVCKPLEEGGQGIRRLEPLNRALMSRHLWDLIQCEDIWLWHDPWHPLGPLIHRFPNGPRVVGIPLEAKVSLVIDNRGWNWPLITDIEHMDIVDRLSPLARSDMIGWKTEGGVLTTTEAYRLFQPLGQKVGCASGFWKGRCDFEFLILIENILLCGVKAMEGKHPWNAASRALLASVVYHIWMERNSGDLGAVLLQQNARLVCIEQIRLLLIGAELN